jgi:hypothetical protein
MHARKQLRSRRFCPQCGESLYYIATFLTRFTGWRKRVCLNPECRHVDAGKVKIVIDSAQAL